MMDRANGFRSFQTMLQKSSPPVCHVIARNYHYGSLRLVALQLARYVLYELRSMAASLEKLREYL